MICLASQLSSSLLCVLNCLFERNNQQRACATKSMRYQETAYSTSGISSHVQPLSVSINVWLQQFNHTAPANKEQANPPPVSWLTQSRRKHKHPIGNKMMRFIAAGYRGRCSNGKRDSRVIAVTFPPD